MRKGKILLYFSIIFVVFFSVTRVNALENVKIKSIDLVDKSINTTEVSKATFDELEMNFDLKFMAVGDYAKYKIVVSNKESKDYKVSVDSSFENSNYISYKYDKADNLKANSDTEFYVTVTYNKKVDDSGFVDSKYSERNGAVLKLLDNSIDNPKTSYNVLTLVIVVLMGVVLILLFSNKKNRKLNVFILLGLLSVPLFVSAADYLKITVNSNVVIEKGYSVDYEVRGFIKDSEVKNYDLSQGECVMNAYNGSVSEENKYLYCYKAIYKGKVLHSPGDNVRVSSDLPVMYYFDRNSCKYSDGSALDDVFDESKGDIICSSPEKLIFDEDLDYRYSSYDSSCFDYITNDNDNTIMQFTNIYDEWESRRRIYINKNTTFKMPSHDVLFTFGMPE